MQFNQDPLEEKKIEEKKEDNTLLESKNTNSENQKKETKTEITKSNNSNNQGPNDKIDQRKILLNLISVFLVFAILVGIFSFAQTSDKDTQTQQRSYSELISEIRQNKVSKIELSENKDKLIVDVFKNPENRNREDKENIETRLYPNISSDKNDPVLSNIKNSLGDTPLRIGNKDNEIIYNERPKPLYVNLLENGLFQNIFLLVAALGMAGFFLKRLSDSNSRAINFGNTKAKTYDDTLKEKITFADVAGQMEAKAELLEVVDFLKRPEEYIKMGAKIPRGVLLIGNPGNGKTLMAKAIAGEAAVPFLYVSGSEFVEMFVGVGAGRVRDLFKKAKKKSPCVIFIDEIDAVGRQRGAGLGGGNDEREQTLNQILVELDGFDTNDSVILIGATNRPDVLDPALLRPGRFDRQVTVTTPDRKEREAILMVHSKNKKLASDVDFGIIAKRTAGFSGADLMNVLNESAILAVRGKKKEIDNTLLREAIEKVMLGSPLTSKVITEEQKKLTAYHEAGHALLQTVIPEARKVQKVTIIPRGRAAGYTFADNGEQDAITRKKSQFLSDIMVAFGGYVTEEIVFGEVSTGASNDLSVATDIAKGMVTKYGMSSLGPISFREDKGMTFLGRDMVEKQHYSEEIAKRIDIEVTTIIHECYTKAKALISKHRDYLDKIANTLIEKEVLEYEEFTLLVKDLLPATPVSQA